MTETKLNIYQRLDAITYELGVVKKNLKIENGKNSYKATGERDVLDAVKPLEHKHGVYSYPVDRKIWVEKEFEKETFFNGKSKTVVYQYVKIEVTYRFVNIDNPSEYTETISYGEGVDSQDKAMGKAMTYADKYALMKNYKISTGDDPDQEPSEEYEKPKQPVATDKQLELIQNLYNPEEVESMLKRLKVNIDELTIEQASKMISARKGKNAN